MTTTMTLDHSLDHGDEYAQARQQERQARWMGLACFLVIFVGAVWSQ